MPEKERDPHSGVPGRRPPTPRQQEALSFIRDYLRLNDRCPTEAELAQHLGVTPPSARAMLARLAHGGHLEEWPGMARSIPSVLREPDFERESKAIVLLAFRNGPIEDVHAGPPCPHCSGKPGISRITDAEMKTIMKTAVNRVYSLLRLSLQNPAEYERLLRWADPYTHHWDNPEFLPNLKPPE